MPILASATEIIVRLVHYITAGESCISTYLFTEAQQYLEEASNIIYNLSKGKDVVSQVVEKDDDISMEDIRVIRCSENLSCVRLKL